MPYLLFRYFCIFEAEQDGQLYQLCDEKGQTGSKPVAGVEGRRRTTDSAQFCNSTHTYIHTYPIRWCNSTHTYIRIPFVVGVGWRRVFVVRISRRSPSFTPPATVLRCPFFCFCWRVFLRGSPFPLLLLCPLRSPFPPLLLRPLRSPFPPLFLCPL